MIRPPASGSLVFDTATSTTMRIRNGTADGRPVHGRTVMYFVASDAATPTTSPPT